MTFLKNKILALVIAIAVVVCGVTTTVVAVVANTPENVAVKAVMGALEDFVEREEIEPIYNMLTGGSVEASMTEITYGDGENEESMDIVLSGKIYFDLEKEAIMLEKIKAEMEGVDVEGSAYISKDFLYINEENYLGGAYGVSVKDLADELKDSIFNPENDSEYALDEETFDSIIESLEALEKADFDKMQKDAEKILNKYIKKFWSIVCDHAEFESETKEVKLGGERKTARVITVTIDGEIMADIIEDMYKFIAKDDSVVKFLEKYEDQLSALSENALNTDDDSLADLYKDFVDDLEESVDDAISSIENEEGELCIEIITPKSSSKLLGFNVSFEDEDIMSLDFGHEGIEKTNKITLNIGGMKLVYDIKANDRNEYKSKFLVDGEEIFSFSLDKKTDKFKFQMVEEGYDYTSTVSVKGTLSEKNNKVIIAIDEIKTVDEYTSSWYGSTTETVVELDLKITIDGSDKMPKAPSKYKKISEITEEDIEALQNIGA